MLDGRDMAGKETGANALELRIENKKAGMVIGKGGEQIKVSNSNPNRMVGK